jgi:hypothetical protein
MHQCHYTVVHNTAQFISTESGQNLSHVRLWTLSTVSYCTFCKHNVTCNPFCGNLDGCCCMWNVPLNMYHGCITYHASQPTLQLEHGGLVRAIAQSWRRHCIYLCISSDENMTFHNLIILTKDTIEHFFPHF